MTGTEASATADPIATATGDRPELGSGPPSGIRAGIAGTRFSATVAAVVARPGAPILVPPGGDADFLAPHPSGLLTQDPDVRARLTRFGLRRIGAVAELPGRRSSPGSVRRAPGSMPGPAARSSSRSGRGAPRSGSSWACRSNLPWRTSSRSGSSSIDWPSRSPASSSVAGWLPRELGFTSTSTSRSPARARSLSWMWSSASRNPPPMSRRSSASSSLVSNAPRHRPPSPDWRSSWTARRRRPASSSRCSRHRPPVPPGSTGSWRGSP